MTHLHGDPSSSHRIVAEQQMRRWALGQEIEERLAEGLFTPRGAHEVHPYLAIARQAGTGASAIAQQVGEMLHWEVVDRDLLSLVLGQEHHGESELDSVDETRANWLIEVFGKWLDEHTLTQQEFVFRLKKIFHAVAEQRSCVFVGRGAQFLLPPEHGLRLRILAPRDARIAWARQNLELSQSEAQRWVDGHDRGRRDFVRMYFHHDIEDPGQYDLVVNLEHRSETDAAELIAEECRRRFHLAEIETLK